MDNNEMEKQRDAFEYLCVLAARQKNRTEAKLPGRVGMLLKAEEVFLSLVTFVIEEGYGILAVGDPAGEVLIGLSDEGVDFFLSRSPSDLCAIVKDVAADNVSGTVHTLH